MNHPDIQAALVAAQNYVVCATYDSADVAAAAATLEIALQVARNNAPIYLRGGDIEMFKLCMAHMQEFEVGLNALRLREVGVVFDSVSMDVLRDKGFQSWLSGVQNKLHADNEERNSHRSRVSGKAKSAELADLNKTAKDIDEASFVLAFLAAGSTVKDALFSEAMSIKNSYLSKTKKEEFATIGSRESKLELMRLLELSASKLYRRYQKSLDSSEASDTSDEFSDDKPLSPIERIKCSSELVSLQNKSSTLNNPVDKIKASGRMVELRNMLGGSDLSKVGEKTVALAALENPYDQGAIMDDLEKLLGDDATPAQRAVAERISIHRGARHFPKVGTDYAVTKHGFFDKKGEQDIQADYLSVKTAAQSVVSSELRVDVEPLQLSKLKSLVAGRDADVTNFETGAYNFFGSSAQRYPELKQKCDDALAQASLKVGYDATQEEEKRLRMLRIEILAQPASMERLKLVQDWEKNWNAHCKNQKSLKKKMMAEYTSSLPNIKEFADLTDELKRIRSELAGNGGKIIAAVHAASPIGAAQASEWAKSNVTVHKNARARLKRDGYVGDIDQDIEEFYRLTGGKLNKVEIITDGARRAHTKGVFENNNAQIYLDGNFTKSTLFHELGHNLEFDPKASLLAQAFLKRRRESDKLYRLRDLTGNNSYDSEEVAFKDSFTSPYVGKFYEHGTTEVFAMGVQEFATPERAQAFMQKDPEHFDMIVGYLTQKYDDLSQFNFALGVAQLDADAKNKATRAQENSAPLEGFEFDALTAKDFLKRNPDYAKKTTLPVDFKPSNAVKGKPIEWLGFSLLADNADQYVTGAIAKGTFGGGFERPRDGYCVTTMRHSFTSLGHARFGGAASNVFVKLMDAQAFLLQEKNGGQIEAND